MGESHLNVRFLSESDASSLTAKIEFWYCEKICLVWFRYDDQYFLLTEMATNRWIHLCLSLDNNSNEINISIDQIHLLQEQKIPEIKSIKQILISWSSEKGYSFPEKITMLNLFSNLKGLDQIKCGENGDLFKWNPKVFNKDSVISKKSKNEICENIDRMALPELNFASAVEICSNMYGGKIYNDVFDEIFRQRMKINYEEDPKSGQYAWIPFTDHEEEGIFRNIYSDERFNASLFKKPQPNGNVSQNCLTFSVDFNGFGDNECTEKRNSLCEHSESAIFLKLQGLCIETEIDTYFTPIMNKGFVSWIGNKGSVIQYADQWILRHPDNLTSAVSNAPYHSLLLGTHDWTIYKDEQCSVNIQHLELSLK